MFEGGLMATADIDLLWDTRRKLSLVVSQDVGREGLMGLLRNVDHSFKVGKAAPYRATNDEGYYVDLIRPLAANEGKAGDHRIGLADDDMTAAAILGLQWLINAPKFEDVAMGADGRPLLLSCVDPRAFALHKFWVSKQPDRNALSRRRDAEQAKAVAALAADYFGLKFNAKELSALPLELVREAKQLLAAAKGN